MSDYITTYTGKHFTPLDPLEKDIDIRDIAHALSLTARAGGHFPEFHSVAQHSIECAYEAMERRADPRLVMLCLLHDAAEAYIADVTRPVKKNMPEYRSAEKIIQNAVYKKFLGRLPDSDEEEFVKLIDNSLLYWEFLHYMDERLSDDEPYLNSSPVFEFVPFKNVEEEFLHLFNGLRTQLHELRSVRIISLDLDGTLFRPDKTISPETIAALQRAADKGIEIVPATGRTFDGIPDTVKSLPGVHYFIATDGAGLYNADGECFYDCSMPSAAAADITRRILTLNVITGAYIDGRGYMEKRQFDQCAERNVDKFVIEYFKTTRTFVDSLPDYMIQRNRPVQIITPTFYDTDEKTQREITDMVSEYEGMTYVYGGPANIDITNTGATKGKGLMKLCSVLGIDPALSMSFGDSENDAEMLSMAGFGFAMANGDKYAYDAADFIAPPNNENGIAKVIEKMVLI